MAAMAATREICDRKLQMPRDSVRAMVRRRRRKSPRAGLMIRAWARYQMDNTAVTIWPMTVATAAPIMPQWKGKIMMGSRMMLVMAPDRVATMAKRGLPSERMTGFMAWPNM